MKGEWSDNLQQTCRQHAVSSHANACILVSACRTSLLQDFNELVATGKFMAVYSFVSLFVLFLSRFSMMYRDQ